MRNNLKIQVRIFLGILMYFILFGCTKPSTPVVSSALTIVNAIPGSNNLLMNFIGNNGSKTTGNFTLYNSEYKNNGGIGYGSYQEISPYSGTTNLSIVQISDTFQFISNVTLNLQIGGIYSFFLTGTDTLHVDTMFIRDYIPYYPYTGDSITGVRFANLSKGDRPVSVDIQGIPNINVVSSLPYKAVTAFNSFPATSSAQANGYIFEFRDALSDSLLATYSLNVNVFKSQTIALYGTITTGISVMSINNY